MYPWSRDRGQGAGRRQLQGSVGATARTLGVEPGNDRPVTARRASITIPPPPPPTAVHLRPRRPPRASEPSPPSSAAAPAHCRTATAGRAERVAVHARSPLDRLDSGVRAGFGRGSSRVWAGFEPGSGGVRAEFGRGSSRVRAGFEPSSSGVERSVVPFC